MVNEINISTNTHNKKSVNVSAGTSKIDINLTKDLSAYYSMLAKDWAIKTNGVVENTDYSAKYYADEAASSANEAALSANEASNYSKSSQEIYDGFQQAANDVLSSIETSIQDGVDTINNNTDIAITGIKTEAQKQIQNIESTGFYVRDDKLYFINSKGEEEEFKSGGGGGSVIFDTKLTDHILTFEESEGWALQGTYVYKEAVAGSRYGYPDFYNKCTNEKDLGTPTETTLGDSTITMYINANGHQFYDIADKEIVDAWYNTYGIAWYYGVDTDAERVFLPRTKWFIQPSGEITEVNTVNEAGLPNITGVASNVTVVANAKTLGAFAGSAVPSQPHGTNVEYLSNGTGYYSSFKFDASLSNPIYGNSDTVQPPSIKQLLYICVGNTVADTSFVDVVTQVENGVKDIDDAVNDGVSRLNSIDSLKTTQTTNCLLEVPQRIKLELNNGTLTLKAGSQVIVPNGFEEDGTTPKFDYVDIESNLSYVYPFASTTGIAAIFYKTTDNTLHLESTMAVISGTSAPSGTGTWYDTTNNIIKRYNNGTLDWSDNSLPLCIVNFGTSYGGGNIGSISQTFNGLGYIGSTVWVDKGVKGLIPNGRNEDGSLKNIEFTITNVLTKTFDSNFTFSGLWLNYSLTKNVNKITESGSRSYNEQENIIYNSGIAQLYCEFAICNVSTGKITSFTPKQPFRAVDYSDKASVSRWSFPSNKYIDLTLGASGTKYTAPANGWVACEITVSSQAGFIDLGSNLISSTQVARAGTNSDGCRCFIPIKKGDTFKVTYEALKHTNYFRFIYAQGEV